MEGIDAHTSSPPSSQPTIELNHHRRGMSQRGKVGRTEAIPSSGIAPQRRKWGSQAQAGPSRPPPPPPSQDYHGRTAPPSQDYYGRAPPPSQDYYGGPPPPSQDGYGSYRPPARAWPNEAQHTPQPHGRQGDAYRRFHATLSQDEHDRHEQVRQAMFGDQDEGIRRRMFVDDPPKAAPTATPSKATAPATPPRVTRPTSIQSPDPLALASPDFCSGYGRPKDASATPTAGRPGTKKVRALLTVSKKPKETGTMYDRRSPSPEAIPPASHPPAKTKKAARREQPSTPPQMSPPKKARTAKENGPQSSMKRPPNGEPAPKGKAARGRKQAAASRSSPEPMSSQEAPQGPDAFFQRLKDDEEKRHDEERQRLLDDALAAIASPEATALETELREREEREQEEYSKKTKLREQRSGTRSHADMFFKSAEQVVKDAARRRSLEAKSLALVETAKFVPKEHKLGEDELYCVRFKDRDNLCPYCSEPLPVAPTEDLSALLLRYASIRKPTFRQTVTVCTMHRAETTIIPLGLRDGFPKEIDFQEVELRLERGWIAARLKKVAASPENSKFYRRARKEINRMGLAAWKDVAHQSTDSVLSYAQPGYYGDLGRAIMIKHFQNLILWGHLILGAKTAPLPETDFIVTVLVPEAAVLLTMEDKGWTSPVTRGDEWDDARVDAMQVCRRAGSYGFWRFRGDGPEGRRILDLVEGAAQKKRRRLDDARRALQTEIDRKIMAEKGLDPHDDVIVIASSDTEAPDASDWPGDDDWEDDAVLARAVAAEERRAAARQRDGHGSPGSHGDLDDPDATPRARRPLSPRKVENTSPVKGGNRSPLKAHSMSSVSPCRFKEGVAGTARTHLKSASQHSLASSVGYDEGWDDSMAQAMDRFR